MRLLLAVLLLMLFPAAAQAETPVVLLIMDEFPGNSLQNTEGEIDPKRFPNLAKFSQTATYYPNATTNADMTFRAIPGLLSGQALSEAVEPSSTLYSLFPAENTLRYQGFPAFPELCPGCPAPPGQIKNLNRVPLSGKDTQVSTIRATLGAIRSLSKQSARPQLWTSHMIAPHAPYRFLASGRQAPLRKVLYNPGLSSESVWTEQPWPAQLARERFLGQAGMVDKIVGYLQDNLEAGGLMDEAMVLLVGDHGASFTPGAARRNIQAANFEEIANVPLLIKYPYQEEGRIDSGSAQLIDLLPTIAEVTGKTPSWPIDGLSLLDSRPERPIRVWRAREREWMERSFSWFTEARKARVAEWNQPAPTLPRISKAARSSARAEVELLNQFKKVRPRSGWMPAVLGGRLHGLKPGQVVYGAVNRNIVARGYSFQESGQLRFAMLLPEKAIREGRNRIQLLHKQNGRLARMAVKPAKD